MGVWLVLRASYLGWLMNKSSGGANGGGGGQVSGSPRRHLYRGGNFAHKYISTTPIGAPIYICPRAAVPPSPPLNKS